MSAETDQQTTAWGDAAGRRRDILSSAEEILEQHGYAGLTMRAIAIGAGVSSGTLYQYFDGKEDVFAALMTRRLDDLRGTLAEVDRGLGIAGVLREVEPQITELSLPIEYSSTGRSLSATASRKTSMLSASSRARWSSVMGPPPRATRRFRSCRHGSNETGQRSI